MENTRIVYKKTNPLIKFLTFIGAVTVFFALGYVVYRLFNPDIYDEYDDLGDEAEDK